MKTIKTRNPRTSNRRTHCKSKSNTFLLLECTERAAQKLFLFDESNGKCKITIYYTKSWREAKKNQQILEECYSICAVHWCVFVWSYMNLLICFHWYWLLWFVYWIRIVRSFIHSLAHSLTHTSTFRRNTFAYGNIPTQGCFKCKRMNQLRHRKLLDFSAIKSRFWGIFFWKIY